MPQVKTKKVIKKNPKHHIKIKMLSHLASPNLQLRSLEESNEIQKFMIKNDIRHIKEIVIKRSMNPTKDGYFISQITICERNTNE